MADFSESGGSEIRLWPLLRRPLTWGLITAASAVVAHAVLSPRPCSAVPHCDSEYEKHAGLLSTTSLYAVGGLATALMLEAVSLYLSFQSAKPILGLIKGVEATFLPPALLCIAFAALLLENATFAYSRTPWFAHAAADGVASQAGRPVYTVFYAEWLVNVPILLIVSGKCALYRSLAEVSRPLVVTNLYIVLAWAAYFVPQAGARLAMILCAFAMYGWASWDMVQWVRAFRRQAHYDLPSRTMRPFLTYGLIALFGLYGLVYVCAFTGSIPSHAERVFYQWSDVLSKTVMLMAFAGIRASQYHDLITMLLVNANTNFKRQAAIDDNFHLHEDNRRPIALGLHC